MALWWLLAVLGAGLLGGCGAPAPAPVELRHPGPGAVRRSLAARFPVTCLGWPAGEEWPELRTVQVAVLDLRSRALPEGAAAGAGAMRAWVEQGGGLVLLAYAPLWAGDLGLEAPDRVYLFRHGDTDAAVRGDYRWGLRAAGPGGAERLAGLEPLRPGEAQWLLGGGCPARVEIAGWTGLAGEGAEDLAGLFRIREGEERTLPVTVLRSFRVGRGRVVAMGAGLDPSGPEGANVGRLLAELARYAGGMDSVVRIGWLAGRDPSLEADDWVPPPAAMPASLWWEQEGPAPEALSHWGVRLRLRGWGGGPLDPATAWRRGLEELWPAGADALELDLCDPEDGVFMEWPGGAPPGLRIFAPAGWDGGRLRDLAGAAHRRDMLALPYLAAAPLGDWRGPEAASVLEAAARRLGRELFDLRLEEERAWDGLGLGLWPADGRGGLQGLFWGFHPGLFVHQAIAPHRITPSAARTVNADFGRIPGIEAGGLAEGWRWENHPPLYLAAAADCRLRPPPGPDTGRWLAGRGAWPDWLLAQVNDFLRPRQGLETLLLWLGKEAGRTNPEEEAFLAGLCAYPLRAAAAARLSATGRGGWREEARRWVPEAQEGFGAGDERECGLAFLQNNHLRLYGSGRTLLWDPAGSARFPRPGEEVAARRVLSASFGRTVLRGAAGTAEAAAAWRVERRAGPGRWGETAPVPLEEEGASLPERLREGGTVRLRLLAAPPAGLYRFRLTGIAAGGKGMLRLEAGGAPLAFRGLAAAGEEVALEGLVPHPEGGPLEVGVVLEEGPGLGLGKAVLERTGDVATALAIPLAAGPRAILVEREGSSHHLETRRWIVHADLPGLVLEVDVERAARGLRVDREFYLTGYDRLVRGEEETAGGAEHGRVEGPWVLRDSRGVLPELAVAPLLRPGRQRLLWRPGSGLFVEDHPQPGDRFALGFFLPRGEVPPAKRHELRKALGELIDPPRVELAAGGEATVAAPFSFPWPRVVTLAEAAATPLLVQENGWWTGRAAVPAPGGGANLLVRVRPGVPGSVRAGRRPVQLGPGGAVTGEPLPPGLKGGWRPGRGCSRLVALRPAGREVEASVLVAGPFVPAPAVGWDRAVAAATLDGRAWSYFDGRQIFLPRREGRYRVGAAAAASAQPHLAATAARVEECAWDPARGTLTLLLAHPPWFGGPLPPGAPYHLLVRPAGRELAGAAGAELLAGGEEDLPAALQGSARASGVILTARPGRVVLEFR